jgi:amino acid transporter
MESGLRPLGQPRGIAFVLIMTIVTLGIYGIYWTYRNYEELRHYRELGVNGVVGVVLGIIIVGIFLLPSYVGRLYKEDLIERGEEPILAAQRVPITGWSGFLVLIPYIGGLIWMAKVQSKLNNFWEGQAHRAKAERPAST